VTSHHDDADDRADFADFGELGPAGVPFPSEPEWLDVEPPADLATGAEFVQRTMQSLQDEGLATPTAAGPELLRPEVLAAFRAPEPTADFVERTLQALAKDRREGFRDLIARHVVPEPSQQFVERTLRALAGERHSRPRWSWAWPLLAAAAALLVWIALQSNDGSVDRSRTVPPRRASPYAYSYSATPLPAVLAAVSRRDDPDALPDASADSAWVFVGGTR